MSASEDHVPPPTIENQQAADPDLITLHILSPSAEIPGSRITFSSFNINIKIAELKTRIQNSIAAAPAPERQRLIYRGHALLNSEATLRQILRPQNTPNEVEDTYTLHLVLPQSPVTTSVPYAPAQSHAILPQAGAQPHAAAAPPGGPMLPQLGQLPDHLLAQAQTAQIMLQNQLNLVQQQIANNRPNTNPLQPTMSMMPMPNGMQITYQIQNGQMMPMPGMPGIAAPQFPPQMFTPHGLMNPMQHAPEMAHNGANGNHAGYVRGSQVNHGPQAQANSLASAENADRPQSAPHFPQPPTTTRVSETIGPQGQRIRTIVHESVNISVSRPGPPASNEIPATHVAVNPSNTATAPDSIIPGQPMVTLPTPRLNSAADHSDDRTGTRNSVSTTSSSNTMAWLLSSPSGPEAMLFAPGHGYFSGTNTTTMRTARVERIRRSVARIGQAGEDHRQTGDGSRQAAPPGGPEARGANNAALVAGQAVVPAQQQLQPAAAPENDQFVFIFQRGWLFLRLYIFTFVLSEPGTWRRYLLLLAVVIICMLPRENPFHTAMGALRRHIDNLVGPPAPVVRPALQPQAAATETIAPSTSTSQATGADARTTSVTAEEAAQRLMRERQANNFNALRDGFFRFERAVALFLASLVPGVGERHVRAREDARREEARLEAERLAAVEEEAAKARADVGPNREEPGTVTQQDGQTSASS